jgi:peptidyl-prolyl cis-trans isomerase B (cyclophilin B)
MRVFTIWIGLGILLSLACDEQFQEVAVMETDAGVVVIQFFEEVAPNHVKNFKVLSRSGFYDGTYFQKVVPGEFVQGGDPNTKDDDPANDGTGGPGYKLDAELGEMKHHRGIVSMARGKTIHSSGSQFFICLKDLPHLDGLFTVFGEVVEGMKVMDRIGSSPVDDNDRPLEKVHIKAIRIEKRPVS